MVKSTQELNPHLKCVNLRLTTLIGQNNKENSIDLISKLVIKTINQESIQLIHNHMINRLDVNDAALGIIKLMENIQKADRLTYDLASTNTYTLLEIIEILKQVTNDKHLRNPIIDINMDFNELDYPNIDLTHYFQLNNWLPSRSMVNSIYELFDKFSK